MKEVCLYGCEGCGAVIVSDVDKGKIYYTGCQGCNGHKFYTKIIIKAAYDMFGVFQGNRFVVEEKKDGSKEKE